MTRSKSNTRSSDSRTSDASNCSKLLLEHSHSHSHSHSHPHTQNVPSTSAATTIPAAATAAAANSNNVGLTSPGSISPACSGASAQATSPVIGLNQARANKF